MSNGSEKYDAASRYFLYRDPGGFYCASSRITRQHYEQVSARDGDAFLLSLGLNLDEVGFGYVAMPEVDLAQSAYDRLCKLDDIKAEDEHSGEVDAINMTIAMCLGYRVQMPTNYPYTTITKDRFASPYSDQAFPRRFTTLPDYQADLVAAMSVASTEWDLSLSQAEEIWTAVYKHRTTREGFGHKGDLVKTVLLSALTTLIKPR